MDALSEIISLIRPPYKPRPIELGVITALQRRFPQLPDEYFHFLQSLGHGDLGALTLYSEPISANEIRLDSAVAKDLLFFGEIESELFYAFDPANNSQVIALSYEPLEGVVESGIDFIDFMLKNFRDTFGQQ